MSKPIGGIEKNGRVVRNTWYKTRSGEDRTTDGIGNGRKATIVFGKIGHANECRAMRKFILAAKNSAKHIVKCVFFGDLVSLEVRKSELGVVSEYPPKSRRSKPLTRGSSRPQDRVQLPAPSILVNHSYLKGDEENWDLFIASRNSRKNADFNFSITELTWNSLLKTVIRTSGLVSGVVKMMGIFASFFCLLPEGELAASSISITSRLLDIGAISGDASDPVVEEGVE